MSLAQPQPIMNIQFHHGNCEFEPNVPVHIGTIHPLSASPMSHIASYISVSGCHPDTLFAFLPETKPVLPHNTSFIECLCGAHIRSKGEWIRHFQRMHKQYTDDTKIGISCYSYYAPSGFYTPNSCIECRSEIMFGFRRTASHLDRISKSLLVPLSISATKAGKIIHQAGTCTITGTSISEVWDAYERRNCLFHIDKRWRITYLSKLVV